MRSRIDGEPWRPFLDLQAAYLELNGEIDVAGQRVLPSGWYIGGPEVEQFESEYAAYCGAKHAVGVANGLDALHLALRSMDIGPSDEVIAPSNIYLSTFPITGGLMSQLAAAHGKPILAYTTPDIPCNFAGGIVCHKATAHVTRTIGAAFFQEAQGLVSDGSYRPSRGREMHEAMRSSTDFDESIQVLQSIEVPGPSTSNRSTIARSATCMLKSRASTRIRSSVLLSERTGYAAPYGGLASSRRFSAACWRAGSRPFSIGHSQ